MKYLITYVVHGLQYAYYKESFDEREFDPNIDMVVYDLVNHKYYVNSTGWSEIKTN